MLESRCLNQESTQTGEKEEEALLGVDGPAEPATATRPTSSQQRTARPFNSSKLRHIAWLCRSFRSCAIENCHATTLSTISYSAMARLRNPPSYRKSPARTLRVIRGRNAKSNRGLMSPSKHKKGQVLDKESLVRAKLQKALADKPIATPLTDSDDSDRLVTKKRNGGKVQEPIYASGGVAPGDTPGAHPSRKRKGMDNGPDEGPSPEKRQQTGQGSVLKRPTKSSLRSPLAPILPNAMSLSQAKSISSPAAAAPLASSAVRPNTNTSLLVGETSILGTLKPRKRQPSILQIIDTNDSSHLTADDENDFLPDDESTPLPISRITATIATPGSSLRRPDKDDSSSNGLKRPATARKTRTPSGIPDAVDALSLSSPPASKKDTPLGIPNAVNALSLSSSPSPPELPLNIISKQRVSRSAGEDSVLAPPISSSPDAPPPQSRTKTNTPALSKFKKHSNRTSASSLQPVAPAQSQRPRRQPKQRQAQASSEFDIPDDSAGSAPRSPAQIDGNSDNPPVKVKPSRRKAPARMTGGRAGSDAPRQRGASILSSISTNSKISKSKNVKGANGYAKQSGSSIKVKPGGGARHLNTISSARGRGGGKENGSLGVGLLEGDEEELKRQREKFNEIDDWGLEFEDVLIEEEGSSQAGYR